MKVEFFGGPWDGRVEAVDLAVFHVPVATRLPAAHEKRTPSDAHPHHKHVYRRYRIDCANKCCAEFGMFYEGVQ